MRVAIALACSLLLAPGIFFAQTAESTEERWKVLEERIQALEAEVRELKAAQASAAQSATAAATAPETAAPTPQAPSQIPTVTTSTAPGPLPVYGGASALAKVLNPDISVIGNFLGAAGKDPVRSVPSLEMSESEVGLQAIIDPYARGDFFLSFGERGVDLEEGYITFTSLPAGFVAKVGKMRSSFGIVNTLHTHNLPWTDRPLVTENLVGGEEGITDAGLSVSRILPAPKGLFLEGTAQVFRGDAGRVFQSTQGSELLAVGHLRAYGDLTEATNLDLGFSYARGHHQVIISSGPGGFGFTTAPRAQLFGMDATLRWKPLRRAIYHSFLARSEMVWSRREEPLAIQRAFGFYTSADYRLNRRWTIGGRYDRSDRADNALLTDSGFSPVITYWPSEFSQVRGQYRFTHYADGRTGNDLLFQFLFVLGAHGAHPF